MNEPNEVRNAQAIEAVKTHLRGNSRRALEDQKEALSQTLIALNDIFWGDVTMDFYDQVIPGLGHYYGPAQGNKIVLGYATGGERFSTMTFLHEYAHALIGDNEEAVQAWSREIFKGAFPRAYARLVDVAGGNLQVQDRFPALADITINDNEDLVTPVDPGDPVTPVGRELRGLRGTIISGMVTTVLEEGAPTRYVAEASDIGWAPGEWPVAALSGPDLGNGMLFVRGDRVTSPDAGRGYAYRQNGEDGILVTVYND